MVYKFKRAVGMSLMLYVSTFIVGIICGVLLGHDMSSMSNIPDSFWYIGMVAAVILTALFSFWYFKDNSIVASAKNGAFFGLTAIVVSSVLDFVLFSLGNTGGAEVDLGSYYGDFRFWIIVALVGATAKVVGWIKGGRLV